MSVPHFEVDINIDGVKIFNSANAAKIVPILGRVHSISPNANSSSGLVVLENSSPFIIGFYIGEEQVSDIPAFLADVMEEFLKLSPKNQHHGYVTARPRVIILDSPMRALLKCVKSFAGYWSCDRCVQKGERVNGVIQMKSVDAPPRLDHLFLSYHVNDVSIDEHIPDPRKRSPFVALNFPMVTGFVIDSMHTMIEGAFGRRLEGLAKIPSEEQLSKTKLAEIERRLAIFRTWRVNDFDRSVGKFEDCRKFKCHVKRQFLYYLLFPTFKGILPDDSLNHIMLLQYAMILMGSFSYKEVSTERINEARTVLKRYTVELSERGIPVRFVSHQIIHIPDDVLKYKCGVETLSAFPFENFQRFFRKILRSGNLPAEQIRNRLIEKSKYQLPTSFSGEIIANKVELMLGAENMRELNLGGALRLVVNRNVSLPKRLVFKNFELLSRKPDNVCLMSDGSVVVCLDFVNESNGNMLIIGRKFKVLNAAFMSPYDSRKAHAYEGSVLSKPKRWLASDVEGKMYPLPKDPKSDSVSFEDVTLSWYLLLLHHTYRGN